VDPRGPDLERFAGADVAVVTLRALEAATGMAVHGDGQMAAASRWLRTAHSFGAVVVNRRADGFFFTSPAAEAAVPAAGGEMFDFTGAGDTAVAAIAGSMAVGIALPLAVRLAALAMSICATRPGMAVASAADLLAVLTPQGRAMRKIVDAAVAAEQMAHWRRAGLRTGVLTDCGEGLARQDIAALRRHCDRLVLGIESDADARSAFAAVAGYAEVDLVCPFATGAKHDMLALLRPDVLLDAQTDIATTELIRGWGGRLVSGETVES
jgi:D-beta-D-heptose 7-phosphate kinase/D-beta-D-heptose 1-phosphate adenosyltransferase